MRQNSLDCKNSAKAILLLICFHIALGTLDHLVYMRYIYKIVFHSLFSFYSTTLINKERYLVDYLLFVFTGAGQELS